MTKALALWALAAGIVGVVRGQSPTITAPVQREIENENGILHWPTYTPSSYPVETYTKPGHCNPITVTKVSISISISIATRTRTRTETETCTTTVYVPTKVYVTKTKTVTRTSDIYITTTDYQTITDEETVTDFRTATQTVTDEKTVTKTVTDEETVTDFRTATQTVTDETTVTKTVTDEETVTDFRTATKTVTDEETVTDFRTATQTVTDEETVTDFRTATQRVTDEETVTDFRTATETVTDEETITDFQTATKTLPPITITSDMVITTTITEPPVTVTTTIRGSRTTITLPASTVVVTTTIQVVTTVPGPTITEPGKTITVSKLSTCGTPTNTAPVVPQATGANALFGCAPGYVCDPPKPDDCNFWSGPPASNYQCEARFCIPAPPLPPHVIWPTNETTYFPPVPGYFNLDPQAFGLSYDIFVEDIVIAQVTDKHGHEVLTTYTTGNWASQTSITHFPLPTAAAKKRGIIQKRDITVAPAVCFATCNACYIEGSRFGLAPELCADPVFQGDYVRCIDCISANSDTTKGSLAPYVQPAFAPYVNFCDSLSGTNTPPFHFMNTTTTRRSSTTTSSVVSTTPITITSSTPATTSSAASVGTSVSTPTSSPSNTMSTNSTSTPPITNYATSLGSSTLLTSILLISLLSLLL